MNALIRIVAALALAASAARAQSADLAAEVTAALDADLARGAVAAIAGTGGDPCPGDCDGNGIVSVDEMVRGVLMAAGTLAVAACRAFDLDGNGVVSVNELIAAVGRALEGCGGGGAMSVCGGPITSAPKLCDLRVEPARVEAGQSVTISFGLSDREGDIVTICTGIGRIGGTGMQQCDSLDPAGETINLIAELPGIVVNLAPGDYEIALLVIDAGDARSEIVTARFTVFRLRR